MCTRTDLIETRRRRPFCFFGACLPFLLAAGGVEASTRFVDAEAPPGGNGSSWKTAFSDLQDALDEARSDPEVDAIWVADGVYRPDRGTGDRDASFELVSGVELLGGFAGGEENAEERDPMVNIAVLTGDLAGDDGPSFANNAENARTIVRADHVAAGTTVDGFTITGANNDAEIAIGGAMLVDGGALTVAQCILDANHCDGSGAGIFADGADLVLENATITGNVAFNGAGVFASVDTRLTASECTFGDNTTEGDPGGGCGGAINCFRSSTVSIERSRFERNASGCGGAFSSTLSFSIRFVDCMFIENFCSGLQGGAVRLERSDNSPNDDHPAVVQGCTFIGNVIDSIADGGAIFSSETVMHITNSSFIGNFTGMPAEIEEPFGRGAVFINFELGHRVENCLFAGNLAGDFAGLFIGADAQVDVSDCTIVNNTNLNPQPGAGIVVGSSIVNVANTILWGNRAIQNGEPVGGELVQIVGTNAATIALDFSVVEDLTGELGGLGNISDDPMFVDADGPDDEIGTADDDLRLSPGSPAIDTGDVNRLPSDTHDLDGDGDTDEPLPIDLAGNARVIGESVDIGALEHVGESTGDLDGDGVVNVIDLLILLGSWGPCEGCAADLDDNDVVDVQDLLILLANFG